MINSLDEEFDESKITPGSFVEFSGILRKNPLVAYMEGFIQMFEVALLFTESQGKQKPKAEQKILTQMRKFSSILKQTGSLDLISESVSASNMKAVVPVQLDYFSNESPADIIDGQFVVLGKVVRYIPEESQESINLLRGTPLAYLPEENLKQFATAFQLMSSQMSIPVEFTTQINSPALLVIPVAIYA